MAKHTEGPWIQTGAEQVRGPAGEIIAETPKGPSSLFPPIEVRHANRNLIATAPDLLEACKAALPQLEWANIHGSRCEELLTKVKAAIAKAEGK